MDNRKNKKIMVTGGLGFIGSNLVDRLIEEGHEVYAVDDLRSTSSSESYKNHGGWIITRDVNDLDLEVLPDMDIIFHLAADARIQPSFEDPIGTIKNNVQTTAFVCEMARKMSSKIVFAGSSSVYGGEFKNPYTFSKWQAEQVCEMYAKIYNLPIIITRFFNVYGPREPIEGEYATVIAKFIRQYKNGEELTVVGDGQQRRDFTYINDIVDGLVKLGMSNHTGLYNLGRGLNYSINEVVDMIRKYSEGEVRVKYIPPRRGESFETLADISKTVTDVEWKPKYNLNSYINLKI
jgi:UDP-glucose 4-epimerase